MGKSERALVAAILTLGIAAGAPAQSLEQHGYTLRQTVRVVPLDVLVTDRDGKPVRGLKTADFTVTEDKVPQRILSFGYEDGSIARFIPPKLPALPTNTFVNVPNEPEFGPLFVLYYDLVNTGGDLQMRFRPRLLDCVDNLPPGARVALFVNSAGLHMLQGFTTDRAALREAILAGGPGPHIPNDFLMGDVYGARDTGAALSNLKFMAEYMAGMEGRKNILWLSGSFPIPIGPTMDLGDLSSVDFPRIEQTFENLRSSQVALSLVSLSGVMPGLSAVAATEEEESIADYTGGRSYSGNNRPDLMLRKAMEENSSFYSLSYAPTNLNFDGSERHIRITLANHKKKGYRLSYRSVYFAVPDDGPKSIIETNKRQEHFLEVKSEDSLYANIEHGAPMMHELLFSVHLSTQGPPVQATAEQMLALEDEPAFFRTRKRGKTLKPLAPVKLQTYHLSYGILDAKLKPLAQQKGVAPTLEFVAAAYDADGRLLNGISNQGEASADSGSNGKSAALFHADQQIDVPAGAVWLRMAVRNELNNRTGTLEVKLPLKSEATQTASVAK